MERKENKKNSRNRKQVGRGSIQVLYQLSLWRHIQMYIQTEPGRILQQNFLMISVLGTVCFHHQSDDVAH